MVISENDESLSANFIMKPKPRTLRRRSGAQPGGVTEKQTYELRLRINQLLPVFGSRSAKSIRKIEIVSFLSGLKQLRGTREPAGNDPVFPTYSQR